MCSLSGRMPSAVMIWPRLPKVTFVVIEHQSSLFWFLEDSVEVLVMFSRGVTIDNYIVRIILHTWKSFENVSHHFLKRGGDHRGPYRI